MKESYHWYKTIREGEYEYIHEFRELASEITELRSEQPNIDLSDRMRPEIS